MAPAEAPRVADASPFLQDDPENSWKFTHAQLSDLMMCTRLPAKHGRHRPPDQYICDVSETKWLQT